MPNSKDVTLKSWFVLMWRNERTGEFKSVSYWIPAGKTRKSWLMTCIWAGKRQGFTYLGEFKEAL